MTTMRLRAIRKCVDGMDGSGQLLVLGGVDFDLAHGEAVAVMGRSGSGKSTLLAVLGLLDRPTSGSYVLDGVDVGDLSTGRRDALRAKTFGFIFQRFCLLAHLSAVENVEVALAHGGVRRNRSARARASLQEVGLGSRLHHRPGQLSGGERQRVGLARALSTKPSAILADEPTGSLDESTADEVMRLIRAATAEAGASLVVVTHDPGVAASMDRTVTIASGMSVSHGH